MNNTPAAPSSGPTTTPTTHRPNPPRNLISAAAVAPTWLLKTWGLLRLCGKNYVLSDWAVALSYGKNVRGSPMIYADRLAEIRASMDWPGIVSTARSIRDRKARLTWLLEDHASTPNAVLAGLTGYSVRGVEEARKRILPRDFRPWRAVVHPDDLVPVY